MPFLSHIELHRAGAGLVPESQAARETAIYVAVVPGTRGPLRSCNCAASRRGTCNHLKDLDRALGELRRHHLASRWEQRFPETLWYRLAQLLQQGDPQPCDQVRIARRRPPAASDADPPEERPAPAAETSDQELLITSPAGEELARYLDPSPARVRFLERTGKVSEGAGTFDRAGLLARLALFQLRPDERELAKRGIKTQRQTWEESFWHRLAYHCTRELEGESGSFHPAIELASGRFTLTFRRGDGRPFVQLRVPRQRVQAALQLLAAAYPDQPDLAIHPIPLRSILHVSAETQIDGLEDVVVRPAIRAIQASGEERFYRHEELAPFRYGNLVYLKDLGVLAELERAGQERKFKAPAQLKLRRSQVPAFLAAHREEWEEGSLVLDEPLRHRRIFRSIDRIALGVPARRDEAPGGDALGRSWFWLEVTYGFGNQEISLARLLQARREGLPYLEADTGWIDLNAPALGHLDRLLENGEQLERRSGTRRPPDDPAEDPGLGEGDQDQPDLLRLSAVELLLLQALSGTTLEPRPAAARPEPGLDSLLAHRPRTSLPPGAGLRTPLRPYQTAGVEWLRFLWENRLGGLLCDEMGLGKTHQVMALLSAIAELAESGAPSLVVCPTTVISHWRDKLCEHAPRLRAVLHHGAQRSLPGALRAGEVVITSYGVMVRDADALGRLPFAVAVFDEVQNLKNRDTKAHHAASRIQAELRLGLSGTPVENSLFDLKALFDLVLPGFLGSEAGFAARYVALPTPAPAAAAPPLTVAPLAAGPLVEPAPGLDELRRIIAPFVLRRRKSSVLAELPDKIEDLRTCALSEDQVKLYRDAVAGRGAELARVIAQDAEPLPYIHIFALLNLLKQICDHPALALGRLDEAALFASGKWDLFREILDECLESGQKVVVFTQFLGMVTLIERHLAAAGVGHATLTGASGGSGRRGELIARFNGAPDCRVFVGSLKAGGTGIDLVAASAVIHYDRWWNAAREDQATDRVHRIGQHRAVQVFRLITEGTLEEKISAIIARKRILMESVVQEDDPSLAKIFTRAELLELLQGI